MIWLRSSLVLLIFLSIVTGLAYPLLVTGIAEFLFPHQARGSLIEHNGQLVGAELIGQVFTSPRYFHGRPSMTAEKPYNPLSSGGSNLALTNPALNSKIQQRINQVSLFNPHSTAPIPVDLIMASGSGLDPHISPEAAEFQLHRVAAARHIPPEIIHELIQQHIQYPRLKYLGPPIVNVLKLNLALDNLNPTGR
ncbi:Potassium-transporting ATPase C chain [Xenorhabdus poinarii G6]|uniref:Potassium-transporting ATPase KdpC subunit n=1 Tax=Xenorhabdus poinarii G6 TaxID=1354304 RepID=A0A068R4Q8_9GAMM|nr:potassium-transporting ATPase subunit KdpC [Xenorhabdus poinarii]CDG22029.1 Potassium-transporting ATPase C chain [Xenorhabdus poinarii G6]